MLKPVIAAAVLAIAGSTFVYAQQRSGESDFDGASRFGEHMRPSVGDVRAFADARIAALKAGLQLTPEQEKNWAGFNSAMHYLGHNGADRLNLRIARAKRDPPDDIIEQMRNEAQFLNDRAVDQRNVADAAEPLFASLDAKQKVIFIQEMVNLSHERGLD